MTHCRLDIFPVELVHQLLGYFWAHEILRTFSDISLYLDAVLLAYPYYRVNFKSIRRTDFDLVCQRLLPDQVISLTLSDDKDTPGQVGLFLSRFRIEQFIHLRSLTVVDVGPDWWEPIASKLTLLKSLCSFFYVNTTTTNHWIYDLSEGQVIELDKHLSDSYAPLLVQLSRLKLSHGDYFHSNSLPRLRHLELIRCLADTLKRICCAAPQLESLNIELKHRVLDTELFYPFAHLNRLCLRIKDPRVSINDMGRLLSSLPRLKHLELDVIGATDLVDGQRWQTLASGFLTFKFMFRHLFGLESPDLDSFRTPFWLEEKRWFVAYAEYSLFSVPYFVNTLADESFQPPIYSTAPDASTFYECVTQLTLSESPIDSNHRFTGVKTLKLDFDISLSILQRSVDLNRVQHLILSSSTKDLLLEPLLNEMPHLYQISINGRARDFLNQAQHRPIEKIRGLEIGECFEVEDDNTIDELCCVFPCVEHLHVRFVRQIEQMFDFIRRFNHLSSASFSYTSSFWNEKYVQKRRRLDIQSTINQLCREQNFTYTYRFDRSSVHIWI